MDIKAHFRQVESGLHAGDAPADNHYRAYFLGVIGHLFSPSVGP
jgi:hypothetical protein